MENVEQYNTCIIPGNKQCNTLPQSILKNDVEISDKKEIAKKKPVSTRHRFDIHTTFITLKRRRTDGQNNVVCVLGIQRIFYI